MKSFIIILLICVALFFIRKFLNKFKSPKVGSIAVFTGGVKVGKSALSLNCAISNYKRSHRNWKIKRAFCKLFRKPIPEEPLLYSNIPLRLPYCKLTTDHLLRKYRFNYGSVVYIDEASLVADSQLIKDKDINNQLHLFFKLFGHETKGGLCVVNTHNISDLHYSLKRTTSQYFYVNHISKYLPFFVLAYIREERYSDDNTSVNVYNDDLEVSLKRVLMRKKIFKLYDSTAFSLLTDNLPLQNISVDLGKHDSLKTDTIVSFRPEFASLEAFKPKGEEEHEKENS